MTMLDKFIAFASALPADQRESMQFLIDNMPPVDLAALKAEFLLSHVAQAHQAMAQAPAREHHRHRPGQGRD